MNKAEFIQKVTANLRENNLKKPVRSPRQVFHISDDDGNTKDFVIKAAQREYIYTEEDVRRFVDAALDVIVDAFKVGDDIAMSGYGTLGLKYRKERRVKNGLSPTGEYHVLAGRHVPKLFAGKGLKVAAKIYDMNIADADKSIEYRYDDLTADDD